jgi:hypothetical protein
VCVGVSGWVGTYACMCVVVCMYLACNPHAPYFLWPLALPRFSILSNKLLNIKCVFWVCLQLLFYLFLILRRIQRDTVINVKISLGKVPVILVRF